MTDPKRWSEAGDSATPDERALVHAGQHLRMPAHDKSAVWERIVSAIPAPTATAHPAGGNTAGAFAHLAGPTAIKVASLVVALVGVGVIAHRITRPGTANHDQRALKLVTTAASTMIAAPTTAPAASLAQSASAPADPVTKETDVAAAAISKGLQHPNSGALLVTGTEAPSSPASRLREESQAVLAARRALRENDVSQAFSLLEAARRRFGAGALSEEREALLIEALIRSGDRARAAKHAEAFLRAYPRSPHAADVQRHLQP